MVLSFGVDYYAKTVTGIEDGICPDYYYLSSQSGEEQIRLACKIILCTFLSSLWIKFNKLT